MKNLGMHPFTWRRLSLGCALTAGVMLSGSAMAEQRRNADEDTCAGMGARYGSPAQTNCMLQQQRRRDNKMVLFLEEQRMHQELGRAAREKLEQKRERRRHEKWLEMEREKGRN